MTQHRTASVPVSKMKVQCMKCDRYFRSFSRIKIHQSLQCPAENKYGINNEILLKDSSLDSKYAREPDHDKEEDKCLQEEEMIKEESFDKPFQVKTEPPENLDGVEGEVKFPVEAGRNPYASGVYRPAPVVTDSDSEYEVESDDSAPEDDDIEAHLGMLTKWNPLRDSRKRKRERGMPAGAKIVFMVSASGQKVKRYKLSGKTPQRWVAPHPWVPHPNQVTVDQCCQYLELRDYPIQVNQSLQERFKDKRKFDVFATPLLKIANPRAHPLILSTLLRAKWYEVMNTETGGASSRV